MPSGLLPTRHASALTARRSSAPLRRITHLAHVWPVLFPCALASAYLVLLVSRFPRLIRWENADSDIASAFTLTEAIAHGHTGSVVLSTQGSWVPLAFGLLTHAGVPQLVGTLSGPDPRLSCKSRV